MSSFPHLHTHSHYSLLEALPQISDLVAAAKADGQTALALTDIGNMYGAIEFYKACKKKEIKPIIGAEFFLSPRTRHDHEHRTDEPRSRLVLLAKDETGYRNLIHLVSKSFLEGFYERPRVDRELLALHSAGLVAILPAREGEIAQALLSGETNRAGEIVEWYKKTYGMDCYAEVTRHKEIEGHDALMQKVVAFARENALPLVAAHDIAYLKEEDGLARELVDKIRTGTVLHRDTATELYDFSFKTQVEMEKAFKDLPEAIENAEAIAESCNLELKLGTWVFPNFPIPAGRTHDQELHDLAYSGFTRRGIEPTPELTARLEYELGVIAKKGYSPYFLVVSDLLRYAKSAGIYTNTRGSAAGSFTSYLCGITTVDPIEYGLPFERFLNPERPSPPDIDMDLADDKRDAMIDYARSKYGSNHVAQIGTFGTMMARAAVRDVSRALGFSYGVGDRIAKLIPFGKQGFPVTIESALKETPELAEVYKTDADAREVLDLARAIEGNARHVGVHAAGVVISPTPVTDFVPIQLDPKGGKTITQYDMHAVEDAGLLKYDFLGLKNLSILADAVARVKERHGITVDLDTIPLDDPKTFAMLAAGRTLGVFQLASDGMTAYLVELKPTSIHDINAMVALYRPGPMGFIPQYIERKQNPRLITYLDPRMEAILKNSYGIITYQDDVLYIAIQLAGYTWLEADKFRKAMGKKIPEEMAAQKEHFQKGCLELGMKATAVTALWEQIETFAAYGFNKSHAASYGNLAYKTAYLKANYPVDYMAALLTADAGDVEKIGEIVGECKRMGITVLASSVNESRGTFTVVENKRKEERGDPSRGVSQAVEPRVSAGPAGPDSDPEKGPRARAEAIRFGLYSIKNFGTGVSDSIIAAREAGGPFTDLSDFLSRVADKNLNKKSLESLIQGGALDQFGERGVLLANIERLLTYHRESSTAPTAQVSLFGAAEMKAAPLTLEDAAPAPFVQKLTWEKDLLGLYVSGHPLDEHKERFAKVKDIKATKELLNITTVIGGLVETSNIILTKKGERMCFLRLADYVDAVEVVLFPKTYAEASSIAVPGACILVKGKMTERNGERSFLAEAVKKL